MTNEELDALLAVCHACESIADEYEKKAKYWATEKSYEDAKRITESLKNKAKSVNKIKENLMSNFYEAMKAR